MNKIIACGVAGVLALTTGIYVPTSAAYPDCSITSEEGSYAYTIQNCAPKIRAWYKKSSDSDGPYTRIIDIVEEDGILDLTSFVDMLDYGEYDLKFAPGGDPHVWYGQTTINVKPEIKKKTNGAYAIKHVNSVQAYIFAADEEWNIGDSHKWRGTVSNRPEGESVATVKNITTKMNNYQKDLEQKIEADDIEPGTYEEYYLVRFYDMDANGYLDEILDSDDYALKFTLTATKEAPEVVKNEDGTYSVKNAKNVTAELKDTEFEVSVEDGEDGEVIVAVDTEALEEAFAEDKTEDELGEDNVYRRTYTLVIYSNGVSIYEEEITIEIEKDDEEDNKGDEGDEEDNKGDEENKGDDKEDDGKDEPEVKPGDEDEKDEPEVKPGDEDEKDDPETKPGDDEENKGDDEKEEESNSFKWGGDCVTGKDGHVSCVDVVLEESIKGDYVLKVDAVEELPAKALLKEPALKLVYDINVVDQDGKIVEVKDNKVTVTLSIKKEALGGEYKYFRIVYINEDGEIAEYIDLGADDVYYAEDLGIYFITFTTTHLSEYGVLASNTPFGVETPDTGAATSEGSSATTNVMASVVTILTIVALAGAVKFAKR